MLILSAFAVSLLSGLIPVVSIEVYLGALAAVTDSVATPGTALSLAAAAGIGQGLAKLAWYVVAARSMDSAWMQRKLARRRWREGYERWRQRVAGRPWLSALVLSASAVAGFPPLMIMAIVAGSLRVSPILFTVTVMAGRTLRFWLLLLGVGWFAGLAG